MSSDRIAQLHEQASEHYLNGDYNGALQAWRDILALDPANEQARDGVRLAAQYVSREEAPAPPPELEEALEEGLSIFDSLGAGTAPAPRPAAVAAPAAAPAAKAAASQADPGATLILERSALDGLTDRPEAPVEAPDPARQSEGIDFGDLSSVDPIPLGAPVPDPDAPPVHNAEDAEVGLAPTAPDSPGGGAAAVELKRRVSDLLGQARAKAVAGERDEALTILGRLAILDEDNAEAEALRSSLEGPAHADLEKIENAIIEGVAALQADDLDGAERHIRDALALAPEHREALHYLETIQARRAHAGGTTPSAPPGSYVPPIAEEDLLADAPPAADLAAVPLADAGAVRRPKGVPTARPMPTEPLALPGARQRALPSPKLLAVLGLAAAAAVGGLVVLPRLGGGSAPHAARAAVPAPRPVQAAAKGAKSAKRAGDEAGLSVAPATPEDRAKAVASEIADGRRRIDSGDFGAAVISFNDALKLDPSNADARAGLHEAGEKYKAQRARTEALDAVRLAFRDGEYAAALRMAYRLPDGIDKSLIDAIKVRGWYDLGVVALRAGDCKEAESHFKDALAIAPDDAESRRLLDYAGTCQSAPQDRQFLDFVEALPFRTPKM